ncbi:MAG TPA: alpha/beta hydrolase [Streptosporangiaceae bacterium]|jgi:acetyl esterase/lipase
MREYEPELARFAVPCTGVTIPYGADPDQFGQLWLPAGRGPHPVVVLLHGGYWRERYRLDLMNALAAHLSAVMFAVWNLEYRRVGSSGGGWPGTFDDVAAGYDALSGLAAEHRLDTDRVALVGHSAGGHLALWLAARVARAPDHQVRAPFGVGLAPVADLIDGNRRHLSNDAVAELLGADYEDAPERYLAASPAALLPLGVRQLIVHGDADIAVPYDMSVAYHARARAAGDACELLSLPGVGHFEFLDPESEVWRRVEPYLTASPT